MAKKSKSVKGGTFADRVREEAPPPMTRGYPAPIALSGVLGQEHAVGILRAAMAADRVHHAWIFHGPRGVGKFTAAMAFAAMLLDPTTSRGLTGELEADPEGAVARMLRAGTHPDLHVITKELARYSGESDVRDKKLITIPKEVVEEHLIIPATKAANIRNDARAAKVFIVDEAELLDRSPTNAPVQNSVQDTDGLYVLTVTCSKLMNGVFTPDSTVQRYLRHPASTLPGGGSGATAP